MVRSIREEFAAPTIPHWNGAWGRLENAMKPTVHDIARQAGVSLATVDRVLNNREGVRQKTRDRVLSAMAEIGYVRDVAAANLARQRHYAFDFILPDNANPFMQALRRELRQIQPRVMLDRVQPGVHDVAAFDEAALVAALNAALVRRPDGVAFVALDTPRVAAAAARLRQAGIGVVTLISDLSAEARDHYVGIDNIAAGRSAASLLGRFLCGRDGAVAILAGSLSQRDHRERLEGFLTVMQGEYPRLRLLPVIEGHDSRGEVARLLPAVLETPGLAGVYSLGAGNDGLVRALDGCGRLSVVAHELDAASTAALRSGRIDAVLAQDPGHEIRSAIRILRAHADAVPVIAAQERIRIEIYLRDTLPPEAGETMDEP